MESRRSARSGSWALLLAVPALHRPSVRACAVERRGTSRVGPPPPNPYGRTSEQDSLHLQSPVFVATQTPGGFATNSHPPARGRRTVDAASDDPATARFFTCGSGRGAATWIVLERCDDRMSYARVAPGRIAGTITVGCSQQASPDETRVSMCYDGTSLGPEGVGHRPPPVATHQRSPISTGAPEGVRFNRHQAVRFSSGLDTAVGELAPNWERSRLGISEHDHRSRRAARVWRRCKS